MLRLILLVVAVIAILRFAGIGSFDDIKAKVSGRGDKGVGDFYSQSPSGKGLIDKAKDTLGVGNSDSAPAPRKEPAYRPVWSQGEADPRRMNVVTEPDRNRYCFYPDSYPGCEPPKKK